MGNGWALRGVCVEGVVDLSGTPIIVILSHQSSGTWELPLAHVRMQDWIGLSKFAATLDNTSWEKRTCSALESRPFLRTNGYIHKQ